MKSRQFFILCILVIGFTVLLSTIGVAQSAATPIQTNYNKGDKAQVVPGSTIVIALAQEPESVYVYGSYSLVQQHVMQAFMDGPIDNVGYEYQAVILDKVPSLDDGDAITQTVAVGIGDYYVNSLGDVVTATEPLSATQMVVTFTLKSDIYWSDGTLLTAADSVLSQEIACHPDTPASKYLCERTASYNASDLQTVVWTSLPGWDGEYFLSFWTPLPDHILGDIPPGDIPGSDYATNPLGWGPFQVDEWIAGDSIQLSRNPYYWRSDLPGVDKLVFKFMSSAEALQALVAGEVHLITHDASGNTNELPAFLALEGDGSITIHTSTGTIWEHIDFGIVPSDNRYVFFDDVEVRQALTLCTNRQQMIDSIFAGLSEIAHSYVSPQHPLYEASNATEWLFNPAQGQAKLEAAGWLVGAGGWRYKAGQKFEVTYQTTSGNTMRQQIAEIFKANMVACGVDVHLEYVPSGQFFADWPDGPVFGRQFDLAQFAWLSGVQPSCDYYLTSGIPSGNNPGGSNASGYSNPAFDMACEAAISSLPGTSQYDESHIQALEIWTEDLPVIPLFPRIKLNLSNPNLVGIQLDATQTTELWNVEEWEFTAEATITADDGGTLTSNDGRVTVEIPAGAFTDTVILQLTPWQPEAAGDLFSGGQFFDLYATYESNGQPATLVSGSSYTLTIEYSPLQLLKLGAGASGLGIYSWDGGEWVVEPTAVVHIDNQTVTATPDHLSLWGLLSTNQPERAFLPVIRGD